MSLGPHEHPPTFIGIHSPLLYVIKNYNQKPMIRSVLRLGYSISHPQLQWRQKNEMLQFLVFDQESKGRIIYLVDNEVTFSGLKQRHIFQGYDFQLPKGVDQNIPVSTILTGEQRPIDIQVTENGETYVLNNRVSDPNQQSLVKMLTSPKSIFKHFEEVSSVAEHRKTLTGFYLRLQAEAYIRSSGQDLKGKLSEDLKSQIFSHLGSINQIPMQSYISRLLEEQQGIAFKINETQQSIEVLEDEADRLLKLYRLGAITMSALHLGSFGYMIFWIDWLGWDIVEPLTFSVTTIYTLIGLRFYRKFNKDRNQETVQETLRNWALKASKRMQLNDLRSKLKHIEGEMFQNSQKLKLAHNRLVPYSTLSTDL